jgi:hypothetical protein
MIALPLWAQWTLIGIGIVLTVAASIFTFGAGLAAVSVLATVGFASGAISLGLGIAATSIAQVDAINGTDNNTISYWLGVGSLIFGVISFGVGSVIAIKASRTAWVAARASSTPRTYYNTITRRRVEGYIPNSRSARYAVGPAAREAFHALSNYRNRPQLSPIVHWVRFGLTMSAFALGVWGIGNGIDEARYVPYSDTEALFQPSDGVLESLRKFDQAFQGQSQRLRNSAIRDMYSSFV